MLPALLTLLAFQALGELLVRGMGLPVPGAVAGMGLLFLWLLGRGGASRRLERVSRELLQHLGLFFVPAGVGVIVLGPRIAQAWKPLLAAVVLGTLVTLVVTALVFRWLTPSSREGA